MSHRFYSCLSRKHNEMPFPFTHDNMMSLKNSSLSYRKESWQYMRRQLRYRFTRQKYHNILNGNELSGKTPCVRQAPTEVMGMNVPTESPSIWDECLRKTPCFQLPSSTTAATSLSQSIRISRPGCLAFPPSLLFFTTRGDCSLGQGKAESVIFRQCITNLSLSTAME